MSMLHARKDAVTGGGTSRKSLLCLVKRLAGAPLHMIHATSQFLQARSKNASLHEGCTALFAGFLSARQWWWAPFLPGTLW